MIGSFNVFIRRSACILDTHAALPPTAKPVVTGNGNNNELELESHCNYRHHPPAIGTGVCFKAV